MSENQIQASQEDPMIAGAEPLFTGNDSAPAPRSLAKCASQEKQLRLPCYILGRSRNRNFFGQSRFLDLIDDAILPPESLEEAATPSLRSLAICGMGGLGKTELAVEYIHTRKSKFDAIFWVDSASIQTLTASYQDIALKLGLQTKLQALLDDPEAAREIVKAWLADPVQVMGAGAPASGSLANWLIVFDNTDDLDILLDFWPTDGVGSIILTSRTPLAAQSHYTDIKALDLPPMDATEAGTLLQRASGREEEDSSLKTCSAIAERLGGVPLAIMQMAHLIRIKHLSLTEFVEYYDEDPKTLEESPVHRLTKNQTIASIWNIESFPPSAIALLRVLSMLDADGICEDILTKGADKVEEVDGYPRTREDYFEARAVLIKSSLVTRDTEQGLLSIPLIVQEVVRHKLALEDFRRVYDAAVVLVTAVWPFLEDTNLNKADRLRKVSQYALQVTSFKLIATEKLINVLKPHDRVAALFNEVSWSYILQSRGYNLREGAEYAALSQQVLEASNDGVGDELVSRLLADSYRFQGITATYMGSDLAVPSCRRWIELLVDRIQKYQDPADIKTMPIAYNELGMALMRTPDRDGALKSWEMSCDSLGQTTKPGELPFPFPWVHRGLVATYFSDDPDAALDLILPILKEREKKLGVDDTSTIETGFILSFLGNVYRRKGGHDDESYKYHERGAKCLKATTGERSAFAVQASYRLARDHFERQKYDEASVALEKCVAFAGDIPWFRAEGARATWKLGRTLQAARGEENDERSRALLAEAMRLRRGLDPDDDRDESELVDDDWDKLIYYFSR